MASFDVVSEIDAQEVDNALNQARKEISTRFDFRDAQAEIESDKDSIKLQAVDKFKIDALREVIMGKLAKRNVSLKNIEAEPADISPLGHARQTIKLCQGIDGEEAKKMCADIRGLKLKVQAQIQGNQVRVTGKNRDDLQKVIAYLKGQEYKRALSFTNYRS